MKRVTSVALTGAVLVLAACGTTAPTLNESARPPTTWTRGPVPDSARLPDGSIYHSQVPDLIPAAGETGNVGWIWSGEVLSPQGQDRPGVVTVFADDLVTVVGHMFPGVGFVPLGAEGDLLPDPQQDRSLTIRVRNESDRPAILEITAARDEVIGKQLIAPPIIVEAGAERDVRIEAPRDRWSLDLRGDEGFFYSGYLGPASRTPGFALVVTDAGELRISQGE